MQGLDFTDFNRPEDFESNLIAEGDAHCMIVDVEVNPPNKDGNPMDAVRVSFSIAAHSIPGQTNKVHKQIFFNPASCNPAYPDLAKRAKQMIAALLIATGVATKQQLLGKTYSPNWEALRGRQVCIRLKKNVRNKKDSFTGEITGTTEFVNIDEKALAIFSPWEDAAKNYPKSQQLLAMGAQYGQGPQGPGGQGPIGGQPGGVPNQPQPTQPPMAQQPMQQAAPQVAPAPIGGIQLPNVPFNHAQATGQQDQWAGL